MQGTALARSLARSLLFSLLLSAICAEPSFSADQNARIVDAAVGWAQSCALTNKGRVWCWGAGILNGQEARSDAPVLVKGLGEIRKISAGRFASCAIDTSSAAWCWGLDFQQSLKQGKDVVSSRPFPIGGLPPVKGISIGFVHMCALTKEGDVYCWGWNPEGELGDGTNASRATPYKVEGVRNAVSLDTGINNTCAVEATGSVKCWGTDDPGGAISEGKGKESAFAIYSREPEEVHGVEDMRSVANGRNYVCGIQHSGRLLCWGSPHALPKTESGFYSLPGYRFAAITIVAAQHRVANVDVSVFFGCAVYDDGRLACWDDRPEPRVIGKLDGIGKVALGADGRGCALLRNSKLHCWEEGVAGLKEVTLPPN